MKIRILLAITVFLLTPVAIRAQETATPSATPAAAPATVPPVISTAPPDLSSLPDADLLVYVNPPKILKDGMPRFVPDKQMADLRSSIDTLKKVLKVHIDQINYLVFAMRVRKPVGAEPMPLPEFLVVIKGGVTIETMAQVMLLGGPNARSEKYGTHDVITFTIKDLAKMSEQMPIVGSYSELAISSMQDGSYVAGNTGFVRAAIDAEEGRGRLNADAARSITRDPDSLISINGSVVSGVARGLALIGADRAGGCDCLNHLGQMYAAIKLTPGGVRMTGAVNADNPETAGIVNKMINFLLQQVKNFAPDEQTKQVLEAMKISVEGNEVVGSAEVTEETVRKMLEKQTAPAKVPASATASQPKTATATAPKPKTGRTPRKRTN